SDTEWAPTLAKLVDDQKVVGLVQGRMEFGPRALGGRSIIGDARSPKMQSIMNLKIKQRESFRPFAPSCLLERTGDYFDLATASPYMLLVAQVRKDRCKQPAGEGRVPLKDWVNQERSDVPAITHVDYSARVQTVSRDTNPRYYDLIKEFEKRTGHGIIINTSFNVRGEPIVCTPEDAYRCFMRTEMDCLVVGSFLLRKENQPEWKDKADWRRDYVLD
ncbi:MAG: carbamoyltransferase C-terminal domain-containing protein, partial [bacterium]